MASSLKKAATKLKLLKSRNSHFSDEDPPLPVSISLGDNQLTFTDQGWKIDDSDTKRLEAENESLKLQLEKLKQLCLQGEEDLNQAVEEKNMAVFQNQLLVEMVAVAKVELKTAGEDLEVERRRTLEYRRELERCYQVIVDAGLQPPPPPPMDSADFSAPGLRAKRTGSSRNGQHAFPVGDHRTDQDRDRASQDHRHSSQTLKHRHSSRI